MEVEKVVELCIDDFIKRRDIGTQVKYIFSYLF